MIYNRCSDNIMSLIRKFNPIQGLVLSFAILILIGAAFLSFPISWESGKHVSFIDALFTSTSAVCVTGLIVVDTPVVYSTFGEVVILLLIQFGGLGIITFATVFFVLMGQEISYKNKLILKESFSLKSPGQVKNLALTIIKITLSIEIIGAIFLTLFFTPSVGLFESIYFAFFHSISAFCNAGFSLFSNNLENFTGHPGVNITIMLLIILGGLGPFR
jgi:trk system potassium uptake protein TrkH